MADDWEQEDWEAEDFKPQLPGSTAANPAALDQYETAGQALLAKSTEPDMSKFADEDHQEPEEEQSYHIKPQPKKKVEKKYAKAQYVEDDTPLDDPEAERLRKQRLEEESDLRAMQEMFGGERVSQIRQLDSMIPKTVKDFEEAAELLAKLFITQHRDNKNYKVLVKALLKVSTDPLTAEDAKEIENLAGTIRADKVKAEKAAAVKKGAKKSINVGKAGASAGLDDYIYDAPAVDDEYDFM